MKYEVEPNLVPTASFAWINGLKILFNIGKWGKIGVNV